MAQPAVAKNANTARIKRIMIYRGVSNEVKLKSPERARGFDDDARAASRTKILLYGNVNEKYFVVAACMQGFVVL